MRCSFCAVGTIRISYCSAYWSKTSYFSFTLNVHIGSHYVSSFLSPCGRFGYLSCCDPANALVFCLPTTILAFSARRIIFLSLACGPCLFLSQAPKSKKRKSRSDSSNELSSDIDGSDSTDSPPAKRTKAAPIGPRLAKQRAVEKTKAQVRPPMLKPKFRRLDTKDTNRIKSPLPRLPKGLEPRGYYRIDRSALPLPASSDYDLGLTILRSILLADSYPCRQKRKWAKDEVIVCECRARPDQKEGCTTGCLNRVLLVECVEGHCPCGDKCSNQRFEQMKYAPIRPFQARDSQRQFRLND